MSVGVREEEMGRKSIYVCLEMERRAICRQIWTARKLWDRGSPGCLNACMFRAKLCVPHKVKVYVSCSCSTCSHELLHVTNVSIYVCTCDVCVPFFNLVFDD